MSDAEQTATEQEREQEQARDEEATNGAVLEDGTEPEEVDVATVLAERDDYLDRWQRSHAEFANFRRRTEHERMQIREFVGRDLLAQFLPVVDDFQRALTAIPEDQRESGWVQGIAMIERKLAGVLERAGVAPIEALGQPFDPAVHEAVATEPGSSGSTVVEVYQPGYRLGQSLLRPAMVKVGDEVATSQQAVGG